MNPYEPPRCEVARHAVSPITDDMVRQIIAGDDVEVIVVPYNSDYELYGWKYRRRLKGELREAAIAAELEPQACQSVYWFCVAFIPLVPKAVYVVMRQRQPTEEDDRIVDDTHQYRALRVDWDDTQVLAHMSFTILTGVGVILLLIFYAFTN